MNFVYALVILSSTGQQTTLGLYKHVESCARAAAITMPLPDTVQFCRYIKVQP